MATTKPAADPEGKPESNARSFTFAAYDRKHLRNLMKRATDIAALLDEAAKEAARIGEAMGFSDPDGEFAFDRFPKVKQRVDELFTGLHEQLVVTVTEGNREEWLLSAAKNDALVESRYSRAAERFGDRAAEWTEPHLGALEAFTARKERGMNLSDHVWKLTDQLKGELELALELGLGDGKSAAALSRDVRSYLKQPHKLFRRVRNEKGQLRLSKAAAAYHPGQGTYRSSYKNALRLAVTENNMAYRTADHLRWQTMDFVIGIDIKLSNNHPVDDICNILAGTYPKDFKFVGWHPFCRCIAVPKLADEAEFIARQQALIDGEDTPQGGYSGEVTAMPQGFTDWVRDNADRIATAKSLPYFITDNRAAVEAALRSEKPKRTIAEIAAERHAKRDAAEIQRRWNNNRTYHRLSADPNYRDVEFDYATGGLRATHIRHITHEREKDTKYFAEQLSSGQLEKECQEVLFKAGKSCILLEEGKPIRRGEILPSLDASIEEELIDIRSITEMKSHYGAAIQAKAKQLHNFNAKCGGSASKICLYFHEPKMYTGDKCITDGIEWMRKVCPDRLRGIDEIIVVTNEGRVETIKIPTTS